MALLVDSATRPGLRAVALALVVIELFAFLRSPLRYAERLAAHQLGFRAVSRWRRWLVLVVGQLNYSEWRRYASGDLLERALGDTDELQDLWLRFVIPFLDIVAVMILGDVVVALLPANGTWWPVALNLAAAQLIGVVALCALARAELRGDRALRLARGDYRAQLVELSTAAPELALLRRRDVAEGRLNVVQRALREAERDMVRRRPTRGLRGGAVLDPRPRGPGQPSLHITRLALRRGRRRLVDLRSPRWCASGSGRGGRRQWWWRATRSSRPDTPRTPVLLDRRDGPTRPRAHR